MALEYKRRLEALEPNVTFLMSLYLHSSMSIDPAATIQEAKQAGIKGVKVYPAGVTTHSSSGVTDLKAFYPVFAEMQVCSFSSHSTLEAAPPLKVLYILRTPYSSSPV